MTGRRPATLPIPSPSKSPSTRPTPGTAGRRPGGAHVEAPGRRGVGRAAILALVVLVTGLGWLLAGHDPSRPPDQATAPTRSTGPGAVPPSGPAGERGVRWQGFAGIAVPVSPTAGPRCTDGGRARCFASTDAGAALAAVNLLVRTFPFAGSRVFVPTIREQVVGPDATAFERLTLAAYEQVAPAAGVTGGAPVPSENGWVTGYRLEPAAGAATARTSKGRPAAGTERTVAVLIRQSDADGRAAFAEYSVRLVWRGSDWALVAPPWGDWRNAVRALTAPDRARYRSYDGIA